MLACDMNLSATEWMINTQQISNLPAFKDCNTTLGCVLIGNAIMTAWISERFNSSDSPEPSESSLYTAIDPLESANSDCAVCASASADLADLE